MKNLKEIAELAIKASLVGGDRTQPKELRSSFTFAMRTLKSAFPDKMPRELKEALRQEVLKNKDRYEDLDCLRSLTAETLFDKMREEQK